MSFLHYLVIGKIVEVVALLLLLKVFKILKANFGVDIKSKVVAWLNSKTNYKKLMKTFLVSVVKSEVPVFCLLFRHWYLMCWTKLSFVNALRSRASARLDGVVARMLEEHVRSMQIRKYRHGF